VPAGSLQFQPEGSVSVLSTAAVLFLLQLTPAPAAHPGDAGLASAAIRSVSTYARYTVFDDVSVTVDGGEVTLSGKVTMPLKKDELAQRIAKLTGVRSIRNEIDVLPVSIQDDQLRRRVARAIYGSPTFWRFAALPNPPIHIVVENGHVTLTGVVPTNVERAVAHSLATGHGEFSVKNALRTDAEVRISAAPRQLATGSS
jgi:hyperosmotically inducible protein